METRHFVDQNEVVRKEKSERHERCPRPCRFRDVRSHECAFETCLMEEIPPLQLKQIHTQCWVCGKMFISDVESIWATERICFNCREGIQKLLYPPDPHPEYLINRGYNDDPSDGDGCHDDKQKYFCKGEDHAECKNNGR